MTIAKRTGGYVETEIDDELVVMQLESGEFFSMSGTGSVIWRLIDGARDRAALLEELTQEYGLPATSIAGDLDEFLDRLRDAKLITDA